MKKVRTIAIAAIVIFVAVCIVFGVISYVKQMQAIDIIGGADGPTSVFVARELTKALLPVCLIGISLIIGLVVMIGKRKKS